MVERKGADVPQRNPPRGRRIVPCAGGSSPAPEEERHGGGRLARVPFGSGVNAEELEPPWSQTCLFFQLAGERLFDRLSEFDESARQRPAPRERGAGTADEQDPASIDPDGVDGQRRVLVTAGHCGPGPYEGSGRPLSTQPS